MMNTYMEDGKLVVKLKADEVTSAIKEYENYMKSKGQTFKKDWLRYPVTSHFLAIYFRNSTKENYMMPEVYICNSNDSAKKLSEIIKKIEFPPSPYDGASCEVTVDRKVINVVYKNPEVEYEYGLA